MKRIYNLLLLLILTLPQSVYALVSKEEAKAMVLAGRYAEALPHLERLVSRDSHSGAQWYLAIARQHLYDFDGAIEALETYREVLRSPEWIDRADSLMTLLQLGQRAFEHTQDVVVIDSLSVPKSSFFEYYRLGAESGHILQSEHGLCYENPAADHRIYSEGGGLKEIHKFQDRWEAPQPLQGIGTAAFELKYPFLRTDGQTLYFACDSMPGLGGYDIYRTQYDADEGTYYQPERLGMPFNSSADDYMMAIDETHQVGWWATNRHAPKDSVTIYLFLLEEDPAYLDEPTVSRARLDCIAETWREPGGYAGLLDEIRNASQTVEVVESLHIVVGDGVVYTREEQFRNPAALEAYHQRCQLAEQVASLESDLASARKLYATATAAQQTSLRTRILEAENTLPNLYRQLRQLELRMRQLEQTGLAKGEN